MSKINNQSIKNLQDLINETQNNHQAQEKIQNLKFTLSPQEKIIFAYKYHELMHGTSIIDILKEIQNNPELSKLISKFIIFNNMLKPYPDSRYEYIQTTPKRIITIERGMGLGIKELIKEYNHQNWLEPFDEEIIFAAKYPAITSYKDKNGNIISFDKENATKVKLAIINQGIFPARRIVESAYSYVANDSFDEYIKTLKNIKGVKPNGK